jgi:hypothetical protein
VLAAAVGQDNAAIAAGLGVCTDTAASGAAGSLKMFDLSAMPATAFPLAAEPAPAR